MPAFKTPPSPVFVVTIERNLTQANATVARLRHAGFEPRIWIGVDGYRDFDYEAGEAVDHERFLLKYRRHITPGEIGAYLSHYRLLKHIQSEGHRRALVFEDDAVPLPDLRRGLGELCNADESVEYVNLRPSLLTTAASRNRRRLVHADFKHIWLMRSLTQGWGLLGYMITARGVDKLLPLLMPIHDPVDDAFDPINHETDGRIPPDAPPSDRLNSFTMWPPLVQHPLKRDNLIRGRKPFALPWHALRTRYRMRRGSPIRRAHTARRKRYESKVSQLEAQYDPPVAD